MIENLDITTDMIKNRPEKVINLIETKYDKITTRKSLIAFITRISKDMGAYDKYNQRLKEYNNEYLKHIDCNDGITSKERQKIWKSIDKIYNQTKEMKNIDDMNKHLLMGFYKYQVPKRREIAEIGFSSSDPNHINLDTGTLVMTDYKTAKTYGTISEKINKSYMEDISKSLAKYPRSYLFMGKTDEEHLSRQMLYNTLKSSIDVGINDIRHAYITDKLDHNKMSNKQLKEIAKLMGHSLCLQKEYRSIN
jgi:hypothetical protein